MSALGHKRTCRLPPKADISGCGWHVRFSATKADILAREAIEVVKFR